MKKTKRNTKRKTNNYGWKASKMRKAVRFALNRQVSQRTIGYQTKRDQVGRFGQFEIWVKERGVGRLEYVTRELVIEYGRELAARVDAGELKPATAQNLLSAVNTSMKAASRGQWRSVSPTRECGIASRSQVRKVPPPELAQARAAIAELEQHDSRGAAIAALALEFGLRSKEASLINAKALLKQARAQERVTISKGTKGGRARKVPIMKPEHMKALELAAEVQGRDRSLIPSDKTWAQWRNSDLRKIREAIADRLGCRGLQDLRSSYAVNRYQDLTGKPAPVVAGGRQTDRETDREARQVITEELGHGRTDVLASYVGGVK
ncbi:MAG: hypothetical protein D6816_18650 [Bacteroidetes bacterium]|nr:MAG: hypothetical protein D6816_18650 [Bacteroidota bacterium]